MAQHSPLSPPFPLVAGAGPAPLAAAARPGTPTGALPEPTRQTLLTLFGLSDFVADSSKQPELLGRCSAPAIWIRPNAGPRLTRAISLPCSSGSRMKRRSSASCASSDAAVCWRSPGASCWVRRWKRASSI